MKKDLEKSSFIVKNVSWVLKDKPDLPLKAIVKLRYRHEGVLCQIDSGENPDEVKITFVDRWSTVSPGQAAVFYKVKKSEEELAFDGFEVLGGGIIVK